MSEWFLNQMNSNKGSVTKIQIYEMMNSLQMNQMLLVMYPCMVEFVCLSLHAHSVRRHTWVLMGPDSNKMLKAGLLQIQKPV